jgi:hypothetical protein
MTPKEKKTLAQSHVYMCLPCLSVAIRYGGEIDQAIQGAALPDELASKIRARLCEEGAKVFDRIMGVA